MFDLYNRLYKENDPNGHYHGTTTVLGQTATLDLTSETLGKTCKIVATGPFPVTCDQEPYSYVNGVLALPNANTPGDCVYEALHGAGASISSMSYDPASDQITATFKISVISIKIVLSKVQIETPENALIPRTNQRTAVAAPTMLLRELVDKYFVVFSLQDPAGTYKGVKSILGETVTAQITFNGGSTLNFSVTGPVSIVCSGEAYTYANGVVSITNVNTPGDCLYNALSQNKATLKDVTYDTTTDTVTVDLKISVIAVSFTLDHQ